MNGLCFIGSVRRIKTRACDGQVGGHILFNFHLTADTMWH